MKISEVIDELSKIQSESGDLEVLYENIYWDIYEYVDIVENTSFGGYEVNDDMIGCGDIIKGVLIK